MRNRSRKQEVKIENLIALYEEDNEGTCDSCADSTDLQGTVPGRGELQVVGWRREEERKEKVLTLTL